jgi:hypothetical protein
LTENISWGYAGFRRRKKINWNLKRLDVPPQGLQEPLSLVDGVVGTGGDA